LSVAWHVMRNRLAGLSQSLAQWLP